MSLHEDLVWVADGFDHIIKRGGENGLRGEGRLIPHRVKSVPVVSPNFSRKVKSQAIWSLPKERYVDRVQRLRSASRPHSCGVSHQQQTARPLSATARPQSATSRSQSATSRPQSAGTQLSYDTSLARRLSYTTLPDHPDLRYFERHGRCFTQTDNIPSLRPHTASCTARTSAIKHCQECGEITSQLRYQYAPTGSAMTGMQRNNKTFLYPERVINAPTNGKRPRPKSAPPLSSKMVSLQC